MRLTHLTAAAEFVSFSTTAIALSSTLLDNQTYAIAANSACWVRQGTCQKITCVAQANMLDTDFITIVAGGSTVVYEFDKAGNGVTAGRIQVNISTDTTAATVAARLATAIGVNQTALRIVNPADGTLQVDLGDSRSLTITENVTDAGFTISTGIMQASAAAGSMFLPAGMIVMLDGHNGAQVGVIRDAADGKASSTRSFAN